MGPVVAAAAAAAAAAVVLDDGHDTHYNSWHVAAADTAGAAPPVVDAADELAVDAVVLTRTALSVRDCSGPQLELMAGCWWSGHWYWAWAVRIQTLQSREPASAFTWASQAVLCYGFSRGCHALGWKQQNASLHAVTACQQCPFPWTSIEICWCASHGPDRAFEELDEEQNAT